jgi:hypothetical protein
VQQDEYTRQMGEVCGDPKDIHCGVAAGRIDVAVADGELTVGEASKS